MSEQDVVDDEQNVSENEGFDDENISDGSNDYYDYVDDEDNDEEIKQHEDEMTWIEEHGLKKRWREKEIEIRNMDDEESSKRLNY